MKPTELTPNERLLIQRRRLSENQREAAERHQVTLYCYRQWEAGEGKDLPRVNLGKVLEPYEQCFVTRRRRGVTITELAEALGLSRWWITQMEYGRAPSDQLEAHWLRRRRRRA